MPIELVWEDDRIEHIARHGVDIEEVLDVFYGNNLRSAGHGGRLRMIGRTSARRLLTLVVGKRDGSTYGLVTARDADYKEQRAFKRQKGAGR